MQTRACGRGVPRAAAVRAGAPASARGSGSSPTPARPMSDPLKVLSSMATREMLDGLVRAFALRSSLPAVLESAGGVDVARRVGAGERCDVVVLAGEAIDALIADKRIVAGSRTDVARSGIAVAVPAGAPRPDIASEAAVRDAVLAARSVGLSTGPSGTHLLRLVERWGMAEALRGRLVQAPPGTPVGALVARGEVALGFQQLAELVDVPGIDVLGLLPDAIQRETTFAGGVAAASPQPDHARALLAFLAAPQADEAKRRHGMAPPARGGGAASDAEPA